MSESDTFLLFCSTFHFNFSFTFWIVIEREQFESSLKFPPPPFSSAKIWQIRFIKFCNNNFSIKHLRQKCSVFANFSAHLSSQVGLSWLLCRRAPLPFGGIRYLSHVWKLVFCAHLKKIRSDARLSGPWAPNTLSDFCWVQGPRNCANDTSSRSGRTRVTPTRRRRQPRRCRRHSGTSTCKTLRSYRCSRRLQLEYVTSFEVSIEFAAT